MEDTNTAGQEAGLAWQGVRFCCTVEGQPEIFWLLPEEVQSELAQTGPRAALLRVGGYGQLRWWLL